MKTFLKTGLLALAVSAASIAAAAPASAQTAEPTATTTSTPTECTSGSLCGIPVATRIIAIDLGATTYGEGLVQSLAAGDVMETEAWVDKTSGIDLESNLNTCGDCVANASVGNAWEKILTGGYAAATGTGEASAGVANASVGAVSLLARIQTGSTQPTSGH